MGFRPFPATEIRRWAWLGAALLCVAGCTESNIPKAQKPVPYAITATMNQRDMEPTSPILIRLFKESSEMEIWKQTRGGSYALLKTYQICKWSGALGPKKKEGDRQAPEGFYTVTPAQMNPNSNYYLSFNIGYPNSYDRSWGRTGSNLMVHGACSSSGCYSMTDEDAGEIFALARDSFRGGQTSFQIEAFPFRMTPENMAKHRDDPNMDFWRMLKVGYDNFELTHKPPKVDVCNKGYVFNADAGGASFSAADPCPAYTIPPLLADSLARKQADDDARYTVAVAALETKAKQAADAEAVAAAKAAEKQQREEERANQPSLLSRLVNRLSSAERTTPDVQPVAMAAVPPATAAEAKPVEKVVASVPKPRLRPEEPAPTPVAAAAPATATASAGATANSGPTAGASTTITPQMTPEIPSVGTFVKKKFLWPEDTAAGAADSSL
jgi:murein L,D-transpeptidase YafK